MITETSFYVKYSEIDKMGIVHHSNYLKWFEIGRRDYLKKADIPSSTISSQGFYLPLSKMECKFKSPAKLGSIVTVNTRITCMSCMKVKFEYEILDKTNGKLLAVGETIHAWTDKNIQPLNIEKAAPQIYTALKKFAGLMDKT